MEIPLRVQVRCDYPDLLALFHDLEQQVLNNPVEISNLKINPVEQSSDGQAVSGRAGTEFFPGQVKAELGLVIYTTRSPQTRLCLDEVRRWALRDDNIFHQKATTTASVSQLADQSVAHKIPVLTQVGSE